MLRPMPFASPNPTTQAGELFSADDDRLIVRLRLAGATWESIADSIGRSRSSIRSRYDRLPFAVRNSYVPQDDPRVKSRHCLRCRGDFLSPHKGVRLCDDCREIVACLSPWCISLALDTSSASEHA